MAAHARTDGGDAARRRDGVRRADAPDRRPRPGEIDLIGEADRLGRAVTTSLEYLEYRINNLLALPPGVPTPRNLRARRALRMLDEMIAEILAGRRARPGRDAGDLLAMLLAVRDEETGEGLTDRELRDQIITFIGAGHETTAVALAWTVFLLCRHPEADARLRAEVADVLGGRTPTADDLPRLAYTRRVIEESLRVYPPVYAVVRDAVADDEIGGFTSRRGRWSSSARTSPTATPTSGPTPRRSTPTASSPSGRPADRGSPGIPSWAARTSASARNSP